MLVTGSVRLPQKVLPPDALIWNDLSGIDIHFTAKDAPVALIYHTWRRGGPYFVVDDSAFLASSAARVGRYRRLFDALSVSGALVFSKSGKSVRVIDKNGRDLVHLAYGRPQRLDLSALMPKAKAVRYKIQVLPRAGAEKLVSEILADPTRHLFERPAAYAAHESFVDLTLPLFWSRAGDNPDAPDGMETALTAWLKSTAGLEHPIALSIAENGHLNAYDSSRTLPGTDQPWQAALWQDERRLREAPGYNLRRLTVKVACLADDCDRLLDFDGAQAPEFLSQWRDPGLRDALLAAGRFSTLPSAAPNRLPEPSDFHSARIMASKRDPVLYTVSWYRLR